MVNSSYTYSKWMSNNDASLGEGGTGQSSQRPQSMFDYEAEWSRSQFDRPHRLAVSYIWEIPGPRTGVLGQIIGGWQLSGVTSGQSGQPFTIITGVDSNGDSTDAGLSDRPNINTSGYVRLGQRPQDLHEQRLLHRAARFEQPAAGQQPRQRQRAPEQRARRRLLEYRPVADEAVRSARARSCSPCASTPSTCSTRTTTARR